MTAKPAEGAYGRNPEHYATRGGISLRHGPSGWFICAAPIEPDGKAKLRGPFQSLPVAMETAERIMAAEKRT